MFFCKDNNLLGFFISFSISKKISLEDNFFKIIALLDVSGKPPLLLIITAEPLLAASRLVLPNGSSHLEQITEILISFKEFKTLSCLVYPITLRFL